MDFRVHHLSRVRKLAERAPQAQALAEHVAERFRPTLTWIYVMRRRLATAGVFLLTGWFFLHVMFGANGMVVYRQKRFEYMQLQKEVDTLQQENSLYNQRIKSLQNDPNTIEKEAREQLHYARPGEIVYVSPTPPPPQTPASRAASK